MSPEESPAAKDLHQALAHLIPQTAILTDEQRNDLRDKIRAFADARKEEGLRPEQIVIEVRQIGIRAGGGGFSDRLMTEAVQWCIQRYYEAG